MEDESEDERMVTTLTSWNFCLVTLNGMKLLSEMGSFLCRPMIDDEAEENLLNMVSNQPMSMIMKKLLVIASR